jgi:hypothetical protein
LGASLAVGTFAALISFATFSFAEGSDFRAFHFAARVWLSGNDPYAIGLPVMRATRVVPEPFYYPFPTVVAMVPFAVLPLRIAAATFVAVLAALLAYAVIARSPQRFPMFFGASFIVAAAMGQWSPLVAATLLFPTLSWLAVLKPNIGLAVTAARPTRIGIIGGGLLLLATLPFNRHWPAEWLRNLKSLPPHPAPIFLPAGALILIALLRWRRPEARLLVAMACVPQLMYFADQLPLWFIPQTRRESLMLSATSLVAWTAALVSTSRAGEQPALNSAWFVLLGVYLPALVMIMRRPNEGSMPGWLGNSRADELLENSKPEAWP